MLPSLKRMRELGAGAGDDAAEPARIDTSVREPQALVRDPQVHILEPQALAAAQSGGSHQMLGGPGRPT